LELELEQPGAKLEPEQPGMELEPDGAELVEKWADVILEQAL
jgi:hypothetical protein